MDKSRHAFKRAGFIEAILAHPGEADASRQAFQALSASEQGSIIEFLRTLQVLPPGTVHLVVDGNGQRKDWPPRGPAVARH